MMGLLLSVISLCAAEPGEEYFPLLFRAVYQGWHQSQMEKCPLGKLHPSYVRALHKNETFDPVCRTTVLKKIQRKTKVMEI